MSATRHEVVSSDDEPLILVDSSDRVQGYLDKASSHDGEGLLHRAFSLFVFDPAGNLLIQQRAREKRLWPLFWSNSCCSHPRMNETMQEAISRRVSEELGISVDFRFLYKFEYQAAYCEDNRTLGSEHELCSVYAGIVDSPLAINSSEINAWKWVSPQQLSLELEQYPERFTPWFKMEWQRLMHEFKPQIDTLLNVIPGRCSNTLRVEK